MLTSPPGGGDGNSEGVDSDAETSSRTPRARDDLSEQIGVAAGSFEADLDVLRKQCIDQDPVRLDVAVSRTNVFANQFMIAMLGLQRFFLDQAPHDVLDLFLVLAALKHSLQVLVELLRERRLQH